jgi:NAD-dependent dihydropyrimidine dehydrogenase PreA subunit
MRYLMAGHSLVLDDTRCSGCARCVEVCPHAVFTMVDHLATMVSRDTCMECGACRMNCAEGAIQVSAGVGCAAALIAQVARGGGSENPSCACS